VTAGAGRVEARPGDRRVMLTVDERERSDRFLLSAACLLGA
jgi:hypothetical protein